LTDLDKIERDRNRGVRAREVLENPLVVEAFDAIKAEYLEAWEKTPARDQEGRERLWVMVKLIDKVKMHLGQVVDAGKIADADLTAIQRRKRFGII
jgi:broad-specificity NMP kinase